MRITIPAVRAATGSPFSGLDIRLRRKSDNAVLATETTDAAGVATFKVAGGHGPMVAEALSGTSVGRRYLLSPTGPVGPVDVSAVQSLLTRLQYTGYVPRPGLVIAHDGDALASTLVDGTNRIVTVGSGSMALPDGSLHSEPWPTTFNVGAPDGDGDTYVYVATDPSGITRLAIGPAIGIGTQVARLTTSGGTTTLHDSRTFLWRSSPDFRISSYTGSSLSYNGGTDYDIVSGYMGFRDHTWDWVGWAWVTPSKTARLALAVTIDGTPTVSPYTTVGAGTTALLSLATTATNPTNPLNTVTMNGRLSSSGSAGTLDAIVQYAAHPRS